MADTRRATKTESPHFPRGGVEPDPARVERLFEDFVRSRGLKLTAQRRRILKKVFSNHGHFTAEQMYEQVRRLRISRATVYRTLSLLVEGHFLECLDLGQDRKFYEHILGHEHHDHLICTACDTVIEFQEPRIEALQEQVGRRNGFLIQDHSLRLFGLCPACLAKADGNLSR